MASTPPRGAGRDEAIDAWSAANPSAGTRKANALSRFKTAARLAGHATKTTKALSGDSVRVQLLFDSEERLCSLNPGQVTFSNLHEWVSRVLGIGAITLANSDGSSGNAVQSRGLRNQQQQQQQQQQEQRSPSSALYALYFTNEDSGESVLVDGHRAWGDAIVHARAIGPKRRLRVHVKERPREERVLTRKLGIGQVSRKWERTGRELVTFHTRLFLARGEPAAVEVEASVEADIFRADDEDETFARICLRGIVSSLAVQRVPINLIILVDTSASMRGPKVEAAKAAARSALNTLQSGDQVTVVSFDSAAEEVVPTVVKGDDGEDAWRAAGKAIAALEAGGSTDMHSALSLAAARAQGAFSASKTNRVMLITDGKPNKADGLLESVAGLSKLGICTTTLGIGDDFNEDLLASLAKRGLGSCYYVKHGDQMIEVMKQEIADLSLVVGRHCKIRVRPAEGVSVSEVYGFPSGMEPDGRTVVEVGDVRSNSNRDVLLRVSFSPQERGLRKLLEFQVSYLDTSTNERQASSVLSATFTSNEAELSTAVPVGVVVERVAKAHTARAMRLAMEKLANDDVPAALEILDMQASEVLTAAGKAVGGQAKDRLGRLAGDLSFHRRQSIRNSGKVDAKALRKELAVASHALNTH